ncbi:hypothetical protein Tco_1271265, partial [Tanacetum coccineum]
MTPSSTSSDGSWPCPFRGFHCCPDGEVGNKGIARLISHLKRLHLLTYERKCVLREAISTDHGLYMAVEETLKALKTVLYKVVSQPDSVNAWVMLLLFPRCMLQVCRTKNRQERRSGNKKSLQQSSILKSLAIWGKDDGITTLVKSILDGDGSVSFGYGGGDFLKKGTNDNTNIRQCLRKVADGHFTAVVKVLSSSGVAPYCDDTIKALEAKNHYKPPPSMPSKTFIDPTFVAKIDIVIGCIKLFPKGTSCERDGLRAQHILDALCGEGSA